MDTLSVTFILVAVISTALGIWTCTPQGKRWIKSL